MIRWIALAGVLALGFVASALAPARRASAVADADADAGVVRADWGPLW